MDNIEKYNELGRKKYEALEAENEVEYLRLCDEVTALWKKFTKSDWQYLLDNAGTVQEKIFYSEKD